MFYVPNSLKSAVSGQDDFTDRLTDQAGKLNSLSGGYNQYANTINSVAIPNMLKYAEVSENDLVGQATTDNTLAYGKAYDAARRNMTRMGINPNSGRFAGMGQSFALNRAAAEAGARNLARIQARNENFSRAGTLAGLGYNYSGLGLNAANSATSALNAAAGNQDRYIQNTGILSYMQDRADLLNDLENYGKQIINRNTGRQYNTISSTEARAAGLAGTGNLLSYSK